jgi:hypothetical protein
VLRPNLEVPASRRISLPLHSVLSISVHHYVLLIFLPLPHSVLSIYVIHSVLSISLDFVDPIYVVGIPPHELIARTFLFSGTTHALVRASANTITRADNMIRHRPSDHFDIPPHEHISRKTILSDGYRHGCVSPSNTPFHPRVCVYS